MTPEASKFFETVLAQLPLGVLVWQMKPAFGPERCRLIFVNPAAAALLDLPPESSLGRTLEDLLPEFRDQGLAGCMARVLEERGARRFGELRRRDRALVIDVFRLPNRRVGLVLQPPAPGRPPGS